MSKLDVATRRFLMVLLFMTPLLVTPVFADDDDDDDDDDDRTRFEEVFVVGDSLSDNGNLADFVGFATGPIVDEFNTPLGVFLKDGRLSDGPLYIESLAAEVASEADVRASADGGDNFAVAGAVANPALASFVPFSLPDTDLLAQVGQLIALRGSLDDDDLVVVFIGSNDVFGALFSAIPVPGGPTPADPELAIAESLSIVIEALMLLEENGAENFLVFGTPNIARAPILVTQVAGGLLPPETLDAARDLSLGFTTELFSALSGLRNVSGFDANVWYFPSFSVGELIASGFGGRLFGISDSETPCVEVEGFENPDCSIFAFWDFVHFSGGVHDVFAATAETVLLLPPLVRR